MANIFHVQRPDNKITLGTTDTTINIASHTASTILGLDASKDLESLAIPLTVANGGSGAASFTDHSILLGSDTQPFTALGLAANGQIPIGFQNSDPVLANITSTATQITVTNGAGTIALSLPSALAIPGKLTAGTFASPTDVTNTREYGFEIHYSGNNYNATAIRARAHAVTTDTSAQFQGALLQAANNDNINVGVLNGALIEAIGKATANAATITMMRGCLVNTEWSAKDTVTDLRVLHVRTHTRDAATEGYVSGTGYGIYIENEAVGGNGQALDAGIYFKDTNLSAGNNAFTHGIDFSGGTYTTAEIKLSNGETINNLVDGTIGFSGAVSITDGGATPLHLTSTTTTNYVQFTNDIVTSYIGAYGPHLYFLPNEVLRAVITANGIYSYRSVYMQEQADALDDGDGFGQLWIHDDTPNTLWFTDDAGTDLRIAPQDLQTSATPTFANLIVGTNIGTSGNGTMLDLISGNGNLVLNYTLYLTEAAAAYDDVIGKGQLWVKNDTPNILMFTDDEGTDFTVDITAV